MKHQILDLKKKQESHVQLLKQKEKSEEAAKRLQTEIQYIKSQKASFHLLSWLIIRFSFPYLTVVFMYIAGSVAA